MNSNYTGRIVRNLNEAFGPHCRPYVEPMPEPIHPSDKIVMWGCVAALALMAVAAVMQ